MAAPFRIARSLVTWAAAALALFASACTDRTATIPNPPPSGSGPQAAAAIECRASVRAATVTCGGARTPSGARGYLIIGGQHTYVELTTSVVQYFPEIRDFNFQVTLKDLIPQPLGTSDGVHPDSMGIRVFFASGPTVVSGTGLAAVTNADGIGTFTGAAQPYLLYAAGMLGEDRILSPGETSAARTWHMQVDPTVDSIAFTVYVAAPVPHPRGWLELGVDSTRLGVTGAKTLTARVLTAVGNPVPDAGVQWSSQAPGIVTVADSGATGVITGVAPGTAYVTAASGEFRDSVRVTVVQASPPRIDLALPFVTGLFGAVPCCGLSTVLTLAADRVPLKGTCQHDDPDPCTLQVYAEPLGRAPTLVASGNDSVDGSHSVVGLDADSIRYRFVATSALGLRSSQTTHYMPVEPSAHWHLLAMVNGDIEDASPDRVMYDYIDSYRDLDLRTGVDEEWMLDHVTVAVHVTANGWIYEFDWNAGCCKPKGLYQEGPNRMDIGLFGRDGRVNERWFGYNEGNSKLRWMNVLEPATYEVPFVDPYDGSTNWSISYEGTLLISDHARIIRARPGQPVDTLPVENATFPRTDGTGIVYARYVRGGLQTVYLGPAGEEPLTGVYTGNAPYPGGALYLIRDGWTVYGTNETGSWVTWYRDPDGARHEATAIGPTAQLVSMGPGGRVVWRDGASMYGSAPPYTTAVALGRYIQPKWWYDGKLYVATGSTFFRVDF